MFFPRSVVKCGAGFYLIFMCTCPIKIKNPSYGLRQAIRGYRDVWWQSPHQHLIVPCGKCHECRAVREDNYIQRLELEQFYYREYFVTLTIQDSSMTYYTTSNGESFAVAPWSDLTNMFKRLRKSGVFGDFRYFFLSEYGGKRHRPHFHGVLLLRKDQFSNDMSDFIHKTLRTEWRRNIGSTRVPVWQPMFTYRCKYVNGKKMENLSVSYIEENGLTSSASKGLKYALKYTFKQDDFVQAHLDEQSSVLSQTEYDEFLRAFKPKICKSLFLGSVYDYRTFHKKRFELVKTQVLSRRPAVLYHPAYNYEPVDCYADWLEDHEAIKDVNDGEALSLAYRPLIYNHLLGCCRFSLNSDFPVYLSPWKNDNERPRPLSRYFRKYLGIFFRDPVQVLYWKKKQYERYGVCDILVDRDNFEMIQTELLRDKAYRANFSFRDIWQDEFME